MAPAPVRSSLVGTKPTKQGSAAGGMAKPSKIRYFKGKAPNAALSESESDEEDEEATAERERETARARQKAEKALVAGGAGRVIQQGDAKPLKMKVELRDVKVEGGRVLLGGKEEVAQREQEESSEEEESEEEEEAKPVGLKAGDDESSEYETDSEEESEEEVKKPVFRPVFVPKTSRNMTQEKAAAEAAAAEKREEEMREQKKLDSKELAGETIRRELAEKEMSEVVPTVDDSDGLDPSAEFEAWRLRELQRLLRDKQAQAARDEEREEIERRRAMPEEQRLKEDMEYAAQTRDREKGQMGFLQKYYHKGAFHQDDELLNRDYTAATESAVDMSLLPKVMQVRNFGKMSRTKYTHLADQDTSQGGWGAAARMAPAGPGGIGTTQTGCWNCGGPHLRKDCPNNNINDPSVISGTAAGAGYGTSANSAQLGSGSRSWGGEGGRRGYDNHDRDRDRDRESGREAEIGSRYRDEGRERRYDEERRRDDRDRPKERDRDHARDRGYSRRSRSRSRSPGRRDGDDRRREDERDRNRDRVRERERDRDRDRERTRDRR